MLGIDLVELTEFKKQLDLGGATFLAKAFRASEIRKDNLEHIAGLWAAKEAVMKAAGIAAGRWLDIHIERTAAGKPSAEVDGLQFEISIAHHGDYAVAVAYRATGAEA